MCPPRVQGLQPFYAICRLDPSINSFPFRLPGDCNTKETPLSELALGLSHLAPNVWLTCFQAEPCHFLEVMPGEFRAIMPFSPSQTVLSGCILYMDHCYSYLNYRAQAPQSKCGTYRVSLETS